MVISSDDPRASTAVVAAYMVHRTRTANHTTARSSTVPQPCSSRLERSHNEQSYCLETFVKDPSFESRGENVLYLAYGSNFAAEKFKGDRGIKPLAQLNVQVPSLRLTFDLPGIPYIEPCFANSARRDPNNDPPRELPSLVDNEKAALLSEKSPYRKTQWHKGLIGVVYEVTPEDYAHIIATEGGGAGYQDILVDCHPFETSDLNAPVPQNPTTAPFKAHTLFAPAVPDGDSAPQDGSHLRRPDPDYAQASARYLKLITNGAAECELPYEYQDYLLSIRSYTITTKRQQMAKLIFSVTWVPLVLMLFQLGKLFVDENGILPSWFRKLMGIVFGAQWSSYDRVFRPAFGDGERTVVKSDEVARRRRAVAADVEQGSPDAFT